MFLSINSTICIIFVSVLVDLFFPHCELYFADSLHTWQFFIGAKYLNFTLLDVRYFCVLILYSEMWLSYLEKLDLFRSFF